MIQKRALAMLGALALAGCGSSSMIVLQPNKAPLKADAVELVYENSTVGVPEEAVARTKQYMQERFFNPKSGFHPGSGGISVHYGYIGYKQGSRIGRYFLGGLGNSDANMVLRAEFFGPNGEKLAETQSTGKIGGGFLGGSSNSAIKKAVNEIGNYAEANFR